MERERFEQDPVDRNLDRNIDSTYVETSSDSGVTWFIVGALVIAAGVLAYLYFGGEDANTTAQTPPAIEAPADTGRASTPAAPAEPAAPMAPSAPAPAAPPAPAPAP